MNEKTMCMVIRCRYRYVCHGDKRECVVSDFDDDYPGDDYGEVD